MMVMTAKVNFKKILLGLAAAGALVLALILLLGGGKAEETAAPALNSNDGRVKFLEDFGWQVTTTPTQSSQVRIPEAGSQVFTRYNQLQLSQGFDLSKFAGKKVMRYVYRINNFPGATEPVYATLLIYKNQVIGGGQIRTLKMPETPTPKASVPAPTNAAPETTPSLAAK